MVFEKTSIQGAWIHSPLRHCDNRGTFEEQFRLTTIEKELGRGLSVRQINQSTSKKGVIRGIHFTESAEGQAKFISCKKGRIWDVFVDLRKESPTFGAWGGVEISAENGKGVFLEEGLGHAFLSLEEGSVVNYLCSSEFDPIANRTIHPLSESLAIEFRSVGSKNGIGKFILSSRDSTAPRFREK